MNDHAARSPDATSVADEVRAFYEGHPYPPPVESLDRYREHWRDRHRRRADHHLFWPARPYREDQSILVAGCGTSQAARHAIRWPRARVTGIDFSATSIRCCRELKRKYKLDNLQLRQLPVERASELGTSFDQVVCTGVLHHLADPDAGLRALRGVLKPNGKMHLMVYAPYGRTGIYMLQDYCRLTGIRASETGIQELIAALRMLPPGHPLQRLLAEAADFRNPAALADALLHPQDRAYSVPQLFDFLENGGMRFERWIRQAPYSPRCGVMAQLPQASRMTQLPLSEQYAAVELFRGNMVRHSFIACRNEHAAIPGGIDFSDCAWLDYVPLRMSDTVCIDEHLPSGVAAVLVNRGHTCGDIRLALDDRQKRLFDAVDGSCTVAEILRTNDDGGIGRPLFEQLWWHDQVVFDASRPAGMGQRQHAIDAAARP